MAKQNVPHQSAQSHSNRNIPKPDRFQKRIRKDIDRYEKKHKNESELKHLLLDARRNIYPIPTQVIHDLVEINIGLIGLFNGIHSATGRLRLVGKTVDASDLTALMGSIGKILMPIVKQSQNNSADIWQVTEDLDVAYHSLFPGDQKNIAKYNRERRQSLSIVERSEK